MAGADFRLTHEIQRVHRLTPSANFKADHGAARAGQTQGCTGNQLGTDPGIELGYPGDQAGPAAGMFDDHDIAIALERPRKGNPAGSRRNNLC